MVDKTTLVIGVSLKSDRYSYGAVLSLRDKSIKTFAFGLRAGDIADVSVYNTFPVEEKIHTITMYLGAARQPQYYDDIIGLNPERVIFNPGAENSIFAKILQQKGIEPVEACTLVMLSIGNY